MSIDDILNKLNEADQKVDAVEKELFSHLPMSTRAKLKEVFKDIDHAYFSLQKIREEVSPKVQGQLMIESKIRRTMVLLEQAAKELRGAE